MNVLALPKDEFEATARELEAQGMDTTSLRRQYREATSSFSGVHEYAKSQQDRIANEGRTSIAGGLLSKPEGSTGMDAIRGLGFEPQAFVAGLLDAAARGVDAPRAASQGLIPAQDMIGEAFGAAGVAMAGGGAAPSGSLAANSFRGAGKAPSFEQAPMIVHHNVSPEGLVVNETIGGMPMPSIGISNANFPLENFGDISLILNPEKIAPRRDLPVYPTDAYTARQPKAQVEFANKDRAEDAVASDPNFSHMKDRGYWMQSYGNFDDNDRMMRVAQFGVDKKVSDPKNFERFQDFVRDVQRKVPEVYDPDVLRPYAGLREYGETRLMLRPEDPYTPSGNRRKSTEYTADSVFKRMRKNRASEAGTEGHKSSGQLRAVVSDKFKNLDDIKANRGLLVPDANELADAKGTWDSLAYNAAEDVSNVLGGSMYSAESYLTDLAMGRDTSWANATPDAERYARGKLSELRQEAAGMPTQYFEAKPRSMAQIGDFDAAVVPQGSDEAMEILRRAGLSDIRTYDPEVAGKTRADVIGGMDEFFFSNASPAAGLLGVQANDEQDILSYLRSRGLRNGL